MIEGLLLLLLAFWISIDTTAWGQFLVSEPLVTGMLAGAILGDVWMGLTLGVVFQVLWSTRAPLGGVLFPWAGPATLAAVTVGAIASTSSPVGGVPEFHVLTGALIAGLAGGELGRRYLRRLRESRDGSWALLAKSSWRSLAEARRLHFGDVMREGGLGVVVSVVGVGLGLMGVWVFDTADDRSSSSGQMLLLSILAFGLGKCFRAWVRKPWQGGAVFLAAITAVVWSSLQ